MEKNVGASLVEHFCEIFEFGPVIQMSFLEKNLFLVLTTILFSLCNLMEGTVRDISSKSF